MHISRQNRAHPLLIAAFTSVYLLGVIFVTDRNFPELRAQIMGVTGFPVPDCSISAPMREEGGTETFEPGVGEPFWIEVTMWNRTDEDTDWGELVIKDIHKPYFRNLQFSKGPLSPDQNHTHWFEIPGLEAGEHMLTMQVHRNHEPIGLECGQTFYVNTPDTNYGKPQIACENIGLREPSSTNTYQLGQEVEVFTDIVNDPDTGFTAQKDSYRVATMSHLSFTDASERIRHDFTPGMSSRLWHRLRLPEEEGEHTLAFHIYDRRDSAIGTKQCRMTFTVGEIAEMDLPDLVVNHVRFASGNMEIGRANLWIMGRNDGDAPINDPFSVFTSIEDLKHNMIYGENGEQLPIAPGATFHQTIYNLEWPEDGYDHPVIANLDHRDGSAPVRPENSDVTSNAIRESNEENNTMQVLLQKTRQPECSDRIDNDLDGRVDYPEDPGCDEYSDNDESDEEVGLPDLLIRNIRWASGNMPAGRINLNFDVFNMGRSVVNRVFSILTSVDSQIFTHIFSATDRVPLEPNSSVSVTIPELAIPQDGQEHTISVTADRKEESVAPNDRLDVPDNAIQESNEDNNTATIRIESSISCDRLGCSCGCENGQCLPCAASPECSDGIDNDEDGKVDYAVLCPRCAEGTPPEECQCVTTGDPGCESPTDQSEADGPADVGISLEVPERITVGTSAMFTVEVSNSGPDAVTEPISIQVSIPEGFSFDESRSSEHCWQNNTHVQCDAITLQKNEYSEKHIAYHVAASTPCDRSISVYSATILYGPQHDPTINSQQEIAGNNESVRESRIICSTEGQQCGNGIVEQGEQCDEQRHLYEIFQSMQYFQSPSPYSDNSLFERADRNGDGAVTGQEFCEAGSRHCLYTVGIAHTADVTTVVSGYDGCSTKHAINDYLPFQKRSFGAVCIDDEEVAAAFQNGNIFISPHFDRDSSYAEIYTRADTNDDTVTTGEEICTAYNQHCAFTFDQVRNMTSSDNIPLTATSHLKGCFGGTSHDNLRGQPDTGEGTVCVSDPEIARFLQETFRQARSTPFPFDQQSHNLSSIHQADTNNDGTLTGTEFCAAENKRCVFTALRRVNSAIGNTGVSSLGLPSSHCEYGIFLDVLAANPFTQEFTAYCSENISQCPLQSVCMSNCSCMQLPSPPDHESPPPQLLCGNNIVDEGEECDDGNRNPHDACSNNCRRQEQDQCSTMDCACGCSNSQCQPCNNPPPAPAPPPPSPPPVDRCTVMECECGCRDSQCLPCNNPQPPSPPPPLMACTDSDGEDRYERGRISGRFHGEEYSLRDTCNPENDKLLHEYTCHDNMPKLELTFCNLGCSNGTCNLSTSPSRRPEPPPQRPEPPRSPDIPHNVPLRSPSQDQPALRLIVPERPDAVNRQAQDAPATPALQNLAPIPPQSVAPPETAQEQGPTCEDNGTTVTYTVPDGVTYVTESKTDECSGNLAVDYACEGDRATSSITRCEGGCQQGVCN